MKLTKADKEYLKDIGYAVRDFEQIEKATRKTTYTMLDENTGKRTKINTEKVIEVLGREAYLSGISRSAFHWSCVRETDKIGVLIYFDSSKLFKQKEDKTMENKYYKGFNRDGFIEWLEDKYGLNSFAVELLDNIIDYAHKHEHVSKDQFAYFISDLVPEIEFMDVAKFCEDTILTRDTLRQLRRIE